jgi:hypothetical protein
MPSRRSHAYKLSRGGLIFQAGALRNFVITRRDKDHNLQIVVHHASRSLNVPVTILDNFNSSFKSQDGTVTTIGNAEVKSDPRG